MSNRRQKSIGPQSRRATEKRFRVRALPSSPLALAIAAILYPTSNAIAQSADSSDKDKGEGLQEIVVTATRRELNVQDVPQSITAFSTADIEKYAIQDLADVVSALPSVNLVNSMPGRNAIVMRGVSTGSTEYYTDSQVSVYLDDQPLTSISQQVDIRAVDIERIESLPGPQGTLFGSSSQTGTLRYISNKPDPKGFGAQFDIEGGATKGGDASYDISGHLNIPVTDRIAVRAVGFYAREGGYVDNVLGNTLRQDSDNAAVVEKNWNKYDIWGGRIAARWDINPDWDTTLSLISQKSKAVGSWDSDPEIGDYKVVRFFDENRKDDWWQASLNVKGNLGFAELSVTGSYFDRNIYYEWDNALYEQWRSVYYAAYPIYDTGYEIGKVFNDQKQNRATYEVRLTSLGDSRFQWMTGAFFERVYDWWHYGDREAGLMNTPAWTAAQSYCTYYAAQGYNVTCPVADTDIYYSNIYDKVVKQKAIFGELTYSLTDRWSITGGARWFEYNRREFEINQVPKGLPVTGGYDTGGRNASSGKSSDTVFKVGTEFHFDQDRMAYFLYSEGFRLGGKNSERAAATGEVPAAYAPDTLKNFELGVKTQWLEKTLQLNAALFLMKWNDIQINEGSTPWWVRGTFNAGKAQQKGVELNGNWNITRSLSLEGSVFLADPQFKDDIQFLDGEDPLPAGSPMPNSPKRKYFAALEYTLPHFMSWNGDTWIRGSWSWHSSTWVDTDAIRDDDRAQLVPPWSTTTLQLGFTSENRWDVSLNVRNLFNQHNIDWMADTEAVAPGVESYGQYFGDPRFRNFTTLQRPRTISLTLSKKW
jgi:outer membrane receptor protein involved in Fe transport